MAWTSLCLRLAQDLTVLDPKLDSPWRASPCGRRNCTGSKRSAFLGAPKLKKLLASHAQQPQSKELRDMDGVSGAQAALSLNASSDVHLLSGLATLRDWVKPKLKNSVREIRTLGSVG
jgi:hypothetical protein